MRPSRGMGAVAPSKIAKPKTIVRKDNPNEVEMMKSGGKARASRSNTTSKNKSR